MSLFERLKKMACSYPEASPFDMNPPLHNLRPQAPQDPLILNDVLIDAAKDEARSRNNPYYNMLGDCPLLFGPDAVPQMPPLPRRKYRRLTEISAEKFEFRILKSFTRHRSLIDGVYDGPMVYKIRVGDELRILKVYPESDTEEIPETIYQEPVERYLDEKEAYERLLHHGTCARGVVPQCYGWIHFDEERIQQIGLQGRGAYALVLEYFEDAQPVTSYNITIDIADKALRGLCDIHAALVQHGDVTHKGNLLLLPGGRVVWIDFDCARCGYATDRSRLMFELAMCWVNFYGTLIPHRAIGWHFD